MNSINSSTKNMQKGLLVKLVVILIAVTLIIFFNFSTPQSQQSQDLFITSKQAIQFGSSSKQPNKELDKSLFQLQQKSHPRWNLPKIIWTFKADWISQYQAFRYLNKLNTKHFAEQSNYSIIEIGPDNYFEHLSAKNSQKISVIIKTLEERIKNSKYRDSHQQIRNEKSYIIRRLIVYFVLFEKGGVFIDESITLVEPLDSWLQQILNIPDINLGDKNNLDLEPKCFGFYNDQYSSLKKKVSVKREFEFEKKLVVFPVLEDQFIACQKQSELMSKLIESFLDILFNGHNSLRITKLNKNQQLMGKTNHWQTYKFAHFLAFHSILQQRQHFLNLKNKYSDYQKLAIDDFGLVTMNAKLALFKIRNVMGNDKEILSFFSKIQVKHLINLTGALRFAYRIDSSTINSFEKLLAKSSSSTEFFMENSFFHTYFLKYWPKDLIFKRYKDSNYIWPNQYKSKENQKDVITIAMPQLRPQPHEPQNSKNEQWNSLEKNIWVIWDKGLKGNSNLIVELCFQNLKKSAENSGFKMNFVTKSNVQQYIDKQILDKINYALTHADYEVSDQARTDLWRIALIYLHGGVYLDASTFTTDQNFDYITNVTQISSGLIWNRFQNEPKNMFFWNAHYSHPANWQIDSKWNTKSQWQLSYENNFIAGVKGSELMREWLQLFMEWMPQNYDDLWWRMKEVNTEYQRWTTKQNRYLLAMDALKYVIGRKEKQIRESNDNKYQNAAHYYQLWSIPGQMNGQQKLRGDSNYENSDYRLNWISKAFNNIYRHEYSLKHAEQILGPMSYQTKFFGFDSKKINIILEQFSIRNNNELSISALDGIVHPESILNRLFNAHPDKTLQIIKYYSQVREAKMKSKAICRTYGQI